MSTWKTNEGCTGAGFSTSLSKALLWLRFALWYGMPLLFTVPFIWHGIVIPGTIPEWKVYLCVFGALGWIQVMMVVSSFVCPNEKAEG